MPIDWHLGDQHQRYAFMEWNPRWNDTPNHAAIHQDGSRAYLATCMGTILLDLSDTESITAFCDQMTSAINLVRKTKKGYDDVVNFSNASTEQGSGIVEITPTDPDD